jgi:transposase InsO family protein
VSGQILCLSPGTRLLLDGDVTEVVAIDGPRVTLRNDRTRQFSAMQISRLAASARPVSAAPPDGGTVSPGLALGCLTGEQRKELAGRTGHVREVLTGYRAGHQDAALPGEPRPAYRMTLPLKDRYQAKAEELGVTSRTVERWVAAYRESGEAGLADTRTLRGRASAVDPRWDEAVRLVLAETVRDSTFTRSAVLARADQKLDELHGPGVVARPSAATAYRRLAELTKGTNAVSGSAKGRRSIADRPEGTYGRLRAMRPGEYAILDTQDLDVFAMEPVTCRWVRAQLTVAQDLFTRCITGLRVTPVSTKAVDVAGVLYQTVCPQPASSSEGWPEEARWPYHGVPQHLAFTEDGRLPGVPVCPPETLVIDHGKAFLSAHVISVCTRLGISIQPAQPKKPTDKPTLERFFKTLREGLIQHLPAYKGPDVYSRGERVEDAAFFYLHELEDIIREWIALIYHCTRCDGLAVPEWPDLRLSPNEMYEVGVARAGLLRIPASPELAYEFFEVHPRTIQHYGVEVGGLRYNGPALDAYRNAESPYGGRYGGKWPIRVNPDDVRYAYFQDPADDSWHRLEWEHAPALGTPFSGEAARYARRLAVRQDRWPDTGQALASLLGRWDGGMVTGRRERRMAVRLAAERAALPVPADQDPAGQVAFLPSVASLTGAQASPDAAPGATEGEGPCGDDDEPDEIFDGPGDGDFYADAFEVLE